MPTHPRPDPLTDPEIEKALLALPGWQHTQHSLCRDYHFPDFRSALAWMMRVAFEAESLDHHPEWTNLYRQVTVRLNTHAAGGRVTVLDLELASRMERLAAPLLAKPAGSTP